MGGAASLSQIPEDLLHETGEHLPAYKSSDSGHLFLSAKHLSQRDPLASLRRRSIDSTGPRRSSFSNKRRFSKSSTLPRIVELPPLVTQLLTKIGINHDVQSSDDPSKLLTSALVAHIFECLGALQHVIRFSQDGYSCSSQMGEDSETQSALETNTKSIGKLLHEIVTLYGLCGDTVRVLLNAEPFAASIEDSFGRLPLHVAVDRDEPWLQTVTDLIEAYPEALDCRDGGGRLPLHIAVDRQEPSVEVVQCLLKANPATAAARRGVGRLPIHYSVFPKHPNLKVVRILLDFYPDGVKTTDVYGRLPLHYAVDKETPNVDVVQTLLQAYPEGASVRDSHGRLPISMVCEFGSHRALQIIQSLHAAFPEGISEHGNNNRLPLRVAVESPQPSVACVHFLASRYSEAILAPNRVGKDESCALSAAKAGRNNEIIRTLLILVPSHDPPLLKDLNWEARKIGLLLGLQPQKVKEEQEEHTSSPPHSPSQSTTSAAAAAPTTTTTIPTVSTAEPNLSLNIVKQQSSKEYVAPYIIQLSTQHLLLSAGLETGVKYSRERSNSLHSLRSDPESALLTERETAPKCNLFQRLYLRDCDAFRVAVSFL